MSHEEIKANSVTQVRVTSKEFTNMQLLAYKKGESLLHKYENAGVTVIVAVSFLLEFDYLDLIKF